MLNDNDSHCLAPANSTHCPIGFVSPSFEAVYAATFHFIWRAARGLGIADSSIDDVVQDVFLTVHRRLAQFAGRCTVENWVFGILLRVARNYRRARHRKGAAHAISSLVSDPDELVGADDPLDTVSLREASRIFHELLSKLNQRHAQLWAMAKMEGLTPAEIAAATGLSVFTVYSRLKSARVEFDRHLSRMQFLGVGAPRRRSPRGIPLRAPASRASSAA
jgi:RNA polymerase sigma-70 factor (ECF subfamily)